MLYTEVIYSIRERLRQTIDDSNIDDREIIFEVNNQRSLFYRNEYNKRNRVIDEEIKQTLCVDLQEASADECNCDSNCTVLRSTVPIPTVIELHHKNALLKVSSTLVGDTPFSLVSYNQFPYVGQSKYSNKEVFVTQHNGYLYFKSKSKLHRFLDKASVEVILENPLDIKDFLDCPSSQNCFNEDTFEYPIKAYVFAYISERVVNVFINKLNIPEDKLNDAESQ